jgi:hypothetical protein
MRRKVSIGIRAAAVVAALGAATSIAIAADPEDPKNIIAAQIRDQGYDCDSPKSATRDASASGPDEVVWLLQCESASYRVHLVPDMAATVEKIDQKKDQKTDQKN